MGMSKIKLLQGALILLIMSEMVGAAALSPGDILFTDVTNGVSAVQKVDPASGTLTTVSSGGNFRFLDGITVDDSGNIIVVGYDVSGPNEFTGSVFIVDPNSGTQTTLSTGGLLYTPSGVDIESDGSILVSDLRLDGTIGQGAIIRIDPTSGAQEMVSSGGILEAPFDVVINDLGDIIVVDQLAASVFKVDPVTGAQTLISQGGLIEDNDPVGITIDNNGDLLVADASLPGVVKIDPSTGTQTLTASLESQEVAVEENGDLVVVDAEGSLTRIEIISGNQTVLITRMDSSFEGITIAPEILNVPVSVTIDIKPGNKKNRINPRSMGKVWIAVLSDTEFDALQIDILTVLFGPNGSKANRHKVKDVNRDGIPDLLLRFNVNEAGLACGDTEATLTGTAFGGVQFTGTDAIETIKCH